VFLLPSLPHYFSLLPFLYLTPNSVISWSSEPIHPAVDTQSLRALFFLYSMSVSLSNLCFPLRSPLKVCVSCFSFLPCLGNPASASIKVIITDRCKSMVPLTFFITR
jgi:hypothetical protein